MPADPYGSVFRILESECFLNLYSAVEVINRLRHEQPAHEPMPEVMFRAIDCWCEKWREMGRRAEEHMRAGRGLNGHPFGPKSNQESVQEGNAAVRDAIRAIVEGRRLKKGPISEAEQEAFLRALDNEDSMREFCQQGKVHVRGAGKSSPLIFWRYGNGDASAVADAYRAGKIERPWDPDITDGELAFMTDWLLLLIAFRKGLSRWTSVLPQVRRRLGPFIRNRTMRIAHREARQCATRLQEKGLVKGVDQSLWAGWCTPAGLELIHTTIRPLWEGLAGLSKSKSPRDSR